MSGQKQFSGDKILLHKDRIDAFLARGESMPITVELDMTNVCNSRCPFCFGYLGREDRPVSISLSDAKKVLDELKAAGALAVIFTGGGEPLVNPHTIDAMEHARSIGLDVALITNGLALDRRIAERALSCCTWIRISLDAGTPSLYRKTHGLAEDSFSKVVENIRTLVKRKREAESDCTIGVGYLTYDDTAGLDDMLTFTRLCKDMGVDYCQFRPLMPRWHEKKDVMPVDVREQLKICMKEASPGFDVLASAPKYDLMLRPIEEWRPYGRCLGANFTTVVSADMNVYVCCHHRGMGHASLGDLRKGSFSEIWKRRSKVIDSMDLSKCPYFCRNNPFNIILWDMKHGKEYPAPADRPHRNFL